ncbi:MAG: primosomal protein N' [Spirochaetaceae bacterium]|jgi:primosomal protein N' (replication factor Y)|nr:primosomal protein N' [Spirochaetaceae bacterium]
MNVTPSKSGKETEVTYLDVVFDVPAPQIFTYAQDPKGEGSIGKRGLAPFGSRERIGYIVGERDAPPGDLDPSRIKAVRRIVDKEAIFRKQDLELAEWVSGYYFCSLGQALSAMLPAGRRPGEYPAFSDEDMAETPPELSNEQQKALDAAITGGPGLFYLYGITGSGKTEVFLRAAQHLLDAGRSVIYLVPEISLTHQTADAIKNRFGGTAAALHSGMSGAARLTEWMRIKRGEIRIVVGPRSAVFAPADNLGLIIIDEEHDGSYKSGNTPRYHARQVAMRRCATEGARLLMGSATPSAEAWKLMADGGIVRLDLTRRLSGGTLPAVTPVSLSHTEGCLTRQLKEEIRKTAQMGRQTILFLNRRGFSYFYRCPDCGYELMCRQCSVSLTYHKSLNRAMCHYCGYQTEPPRVCPQCGSVSAGYAGFGTEMIEEEISKTFPDLKIRRADADSVGKKGRLQELLGSFRAGDFDILLGTQMVAKGLNFPGVGLVGVVLADTGMHLPDFRAAERTFSLIVQVAGRSGRYFPDGKVIVQTLRLQDPVISRACALDVPGFFNGELAQRKILGFPPYSRLIRFTVRSRSEARSEAAIQRLADLAGPRLPRDADALGPAVCPIGVIAGNHRRQLLLRGASMGTLHGAVRGILQEYEQKKDSQTYLEVDVDPVSLL